MKVRLLCLVSLTALTLKAASADYQSFIEQTVSFVRTGGAQYAGEMYDLRKVQGRAQSQEALLEESRAAVIAANNRLAEAIKKTTSIKPFEFIERPYGCRDVQFPLDRNVSSLLRDTRHQYHQAFGINPKINLLALPPAAQKDYCSQLNQLSDECNLYFCNEELSKAAIVKGRILHQIVGLHQITEKIASFKLHALTILATNAVSKRSPKRAAELQLYASQLLIALMFDRDLRIICLGYGPQLISYWEAQAILDRQDPRQDSPFAPSLYHRIFYGTRTIGYLDLLRAINPENEERT